MRKGELTIEVALVLPIFLMSMMSLISLIYVLRIDMRIREAIYKESQYVAARKPWNEGYGIDGIRANVMAYLGNDTVITGFIDESRGGIDFSNSDLSNPEIVDIRVIYNSKIPFDIFHIFSFSLEERVVCHTWMGYIDGLNGHYRDGTIVYVTENSQVYHRSRNCSHIRLAIVQINGDEVDQQRNSNGGKYRSCSLCHSRKNMSVLYITSEGDKYHASLACSGLKRSYRAVPLYLVGDKRPCSRCG